ncbi:MAG: hypothetical protein ACE5FG_12755 [Myxococcota bacterium]
MDWISASTLAPLVLIAALSVLAGLRMRRAVPPATRPLSRARMPPSRGEDTARPDSALDPVPRDPGSEAPPSHQLSLIARALRDPLRQLRRAERLPPQALERLEHIAWQARMLALPRRPMYAKMTAPMALLQEAAERVPTLRHGSVGISWSLTSRQPVHVDPERARAAFEEILRASGACCGDRSRLAIRVAPGNDEGYPVAIEIESGGPGAEPDALAFLVGQHLLESEGARVRLDGRITRIELRTSPPEARLPHGLSRLADA